MTKSRRSHGIAVIRYRVILIACALITASTFAPATAQTTSPTAYGRIIGSLVDAQTGEPLIGGGVFLQGTRIGGVTDLDGNYAIERVPEGVHTVAASFVGFQTTHVMNVKIHAGETVRLELALQPALLEMQEVVVEAEAVRNTEASLLKERQKAASVSDAISAEMISRGGSGDAASAMSRVTGASVVGGKYVFIRGLGSRYITTQLNGALLPSADPDKQAVHLDMFPSNLLESIVTTKTATPDRPGDFTGGAINITTKSFPEAFTMSFSASATYNTETTWQDSFLTDPGGMTNWTATDDGERDLPDVFTDDTSVPFYSQVYQDAAQAALLDTLTRSFNSNMAPTTTTAPISKSYAFSIGNRYEVFGNPLGMLGSVTYGRNFSSYHNGDSGRYTLPGAAADSLNPDFLLSDASSSDDASWSAMANASYKPHPNHQLDFSYTRSQDAETNARYQSGIVPKDNIRAGSGMYETRVIHYTERTIGSLQLRGEHYLPDFAHSRISWSATQSSSTQDEPDVRYFTNHMRFRTRNGVADTAYTISPDIYPVPARYFRDMKEDLSDFTLDYEIPFTSWTGQSSKIKTGGQYVTKERVFHESRYDIRDDKANYDGDPVAYFGDAAGIVSTGSYYQFGTYVQDATDPAASYRGTQDVSAVYGMFDMSLLPYLRFVGGARLESTDLQVASYDTSVNSAHISEHDLLPSANLVFSVGDNTNLRAAYSQTIARPTFRELAPYESFHFVGDFVFIGNEDLERTLAHNFDLRWEWFPRAGEIYAVSGFYKLFRNPIEKVVISNNGAVEYQNVSEATVRGLEFEFRKSLDLVSEYLRHFQVTGNLTLADSRVTIPESEMLYILQADSNASNSRPLQGQSPYVVNIGLSYMNPTSGTSANLSYNRFGDRLSEVALHGVPDIYEQARSMLDLTVSQRLGRGLSFKFKATNLLNADYAKAHEYKGVKYYYSRYTPGRSYSFGFSYSVGG